MEDQIRGFVRGYNPYQRLTNLSGVLVLVGLPGCGKSTLSSRMRAEMESRNIECLVVDYDALFTKMAVEGGKVSFDAQLWHQSRETAFTTALSAFSYSPSGKSPVCIIDDNMYYRSMRHLYYRLARQCTRLQCPQLNFAFSYSASLVQTGYCQLYLNEDVELCVERDSKRGRPVGESLIRRMATRIEPPNAEAFPWEAQTIEISGLKLDAADLGELVAQILVGLRHVPPPPPQSDEELDAERKSAQERNLRSFVHQLDLSIRKNVATRISSADPALRGSLGQALHFLKTNFLRCASEYASQVLGETAALQDFERQAFLLQEILTPCQSSSSIPPHGH